jgi:hypothetical protein
MPMVPKYIIRYNANKTKQRIVTMRIAVSPEDDLFLSLGTKRSTPVKTIKYTNIDHATSDEH